MTKPDLTKNYDYARLVDEEKRHYTDIEVTADLKEGGVHAGDCWQYYWQRVAEDLASGPVAIGDYLQQCFPDDTGTLKVLSLGSGYCGNEIDLARQLKGKVHVVCTDINEQLFVQAQRVVEEEQLSMEFRTEDLNFIAIEPGQYHMIFAHAVLHHVINLEHLFDQISTGLVEGGFLHLVEVVGENRRLLWQDNEAFANRLLDTLPRAITKGYRLAVKPEDSGMEGIRQEDIPVELQKGFDPIYEHTHGAFMRFICTNGRLAPRFNPRDPAARRCLDFLIACDRAAVQHGILRPLEIWGVYQLKHG